MKRIEDLILLERTERQAHLDLSELCLERGGNITSHRGVLAQYLGTNIPAGLNTLRLCHACHNGKCSNPKHLYWGTASENTLDIVKNGNHNFQGPENNNRRMAAGIHPFQIEYTCTECGKVGKGPWFRSNHFENC